MRRIRSTGESLRAQLDRGRNLRLEGRLDEALVYFEAALRTDSRCARAHAGHGATLAKMGHTARALEAYWYCLHLQPVNPRVYAALASLYLVQGRADRAADFFRISVAQNPDNEVVRSNLLFTLNFDNRCGPARIFREHREFGRRHDHPVSPPNARRREGRLRIGYVSGDFCDYPVSYFFEPILANHNRDAFETTLYSSTLEPDFVTERLRRLADRWRDICSTGDEAVARMAREDGIDILVDLSGHTSIARLGVFARKPAPVQVTYLGYPNTTGLSAMDYRITDACADPPGMTERWHTEELIRLPHGFLCYLPRGTTPAVAAAPCLKTGNVTFGSCSKPLKWNDELIRTWASILRSVPDSRLLLHHSGGGKDGACIFERFFAHGIDPSRIGVTGALNWEAHWEWFHQIDLALDPFPYHGTTASCETLWMGVPMITLAGRSHVTRVGVSLLTRLGLERLITNSLQEYVDLAVRLARNRARLASLRAGMRHRMLGSPLMDGPRIARTIEDAYRRIWQNAERSPRRARPRAGRERF